MTLYVYIYIYIYLYVMYMYLYMIPEFYYTALQHVVLPILLCYSTNFGDRPQKATGAGTFDRQVKM